MGQKGWRNHQKAQQIKAAATIPSNLVAYTQIQVTDLPNPNSLSRTISSPLPRQSLADLGDRARSFIRAGEVALAAGFWIAAIAATADLMAAAVFLAAALAVSLVGLWTDPVKSTLAKIYLSGAVIIFLSGSGLFVYARHDVVIPESVLTYQLSKIHDIEDTLGNKSEYDLQNAFDVDKMFEINVKIAKEKFLKWEHSGDNSFSLTGYLVDGAQLNMDTSLTEKWKEAGQIYVDGRPGSLFLFVLTGKYIRMRQKVINLKSAVLPSGINDDLDDIISATQSNYITLQRMINDSLRGHPETVVDFGNSFSRSFQVLQDNYFANAEKLRPKVDRLITDVKTYTRVDRK